MIRRIKADIRTLEWTDALEMLSIGGFICSAFVVCAIWSGGLP